MDETELFEKNLRLVGYFAHRLKGMAQPAYYFDIEDLYQEGCIGLWKAAKTFDSSKGIRFATYAGRCITNEILMYLRKTTKRFVCPSLDSPIPEQSPDGVQTTTKEMIHDRYKWYTKEINYDNHLESTILAEELKEFYENHDYRDRTRQEYLWEREKAVFELIMDGKRQIEIKDILGWSQRVIAQDFANIRHRIKKHWLEDCV